jgi:hypothetical protein
MSNLLAFFQGQISDRDVRPGTAERFAEMQLKVEKALAAAEALLSRQSSPASAEIFRLVLDLAGVLDEKVFAEAFGALFPKSPAVTMALKARAVSQLRELAGHILKRSPEPELCRRADELLAFSGRLACLGNSKACTESG